MMMMMMIVVVVCGIGWKDVDIRWKGCSYDGGGGSGASRDRVDGVSRRMWRIGGRSGCIDRSVTGSGVWVDEVIGKCL